MNNKLTKKQSDQLKALAEMPYDAIDYSDIAPLTDDFWKGAVRNPFYRPLKQSTTVRFDADVLIWLRSQGKGYQTRINKILRDAMLQEASRDG